jgi:hypothetical protein
MSPPEAPQPSGAQSLALPSASPDLLSQSASRPASTVSLVTALPVQLTALVIVGRCLPPVVSACLEKDPPPLAKWMLAGAAFVIVIIAASTPSLRAALSAVTRYLPGGKS